MLILLVSKAEFNVHRASHQRMQRSIVSPRSLARDHRQLASTSYFYKLFDELPQPVNVVLRHQVRLIQSGGLGHARVLHEDPLERPLGGQSSSWDLERTNQLSTLCQLVSPLARSRERRYTPLGIQ
jgi:hypothetical protein